MVSLIIANTRSVVTNKYRVQMAITTSSGISKEIFVKKEDTYEYDRVATVDDLEHLGTTPLPVQGYFRDLEFYKDFDDVNAAKTFSDGVEERVQRLVIDYNSYQGNFVGSDFTTIHS